MAAKLTIVVKDKLPKMIPIFKKSIKKAIAKGAQKTDVFIADRCIVIDWGKEPGIEASKVLQQYPKKEYIDLLEI